MFQNNVNRETRVLYMGFGLVGNDHELDEKLTSDMIQGLSTLEHDSSDSIKLIINCQGGDQQSGLGIYDYIMHLRSKGIEIHGVVLGHAQSMAAWILQACTTRAAGRSSSIMIHNGNRANTEFERKQDSLCRQILLNRIREKNPSFSEAKLKNMLSRDTYLSAHEAFDLGLIDQVLP